MESREAPQIPQHHQHQQHNMILGGHNSAYSNISMINSNNLHPSGGFPFNSQQSKPPPSSDCVGGDPLDGSSPPSCGSMRFGMESAKKKRGRPRKYTPDGNIALGLSPTPISPSPTSLPQQRQQHQLHQQHAPAPVDSGSAGGVASDLPSKRNRGRPPGSGKKQLDALGGVGGVGFTPHVLTVKAGEDIASKVMAFSQQGPRTVCILSANGAICNVTLRQPAMTGGTVTYEGQFEIISLSGSFLLSENCGSQGGSGGLSISLAGSDGRVLGGAVAGMLMAATPVQVIVGSFIAEGKKSNSVVSKYGSSSAPTSEMLNFAAPLTTASPPSQGASGESSDENGSSPLNRDSQIFSSATQPMHSMNMYHQVWAAQNQH